ncbi:hypothetical protein ON010_g11490 [Phytophthora cinnamomi]|nr:hypothetical protein ON010_g11490 [Phytophthora cinnamomi]
MPGGGMYAAGRGYLPHILVMHRSIFSLDGVLRSMGRDRTAAFRSQDVGYFWATNQKRSPWNVAAHFYDDSSTSRCGRAVMPSCADLALPGIGAPASPDPRHTAHIAGSRGNPGPGGAGSVILGLGGTTLQPTVLWLASISYASQTTNNGAKYRALLTGLRYAMRKNMLWLHIVGDNNLIITQLRKRRGDLATSKDSMDSADCWLTDSWSLPGYITYVITTRQRTGLPTQPWTQNRVNRRWGKT